MIVVDVLIVAILVLAVAAGVARGLFASLGTLLGLVAGGVAAAWLVPLVNAWLPTPTLRSVASLGAAVALLALGAAIGGVIGKALRTGADRIRLRGVERFLGGVAGLLVAVFGVALVAPAITLTGAPAVASAIASSRVLQTIDLLTPDPLDAAMAELRGALVEDGLPRLRELLVPGTAPLAPPVALDDPQLQRAAASVARIFGTAYACGTSSSGSGFVAAPGLVVTNAHVVAGVDDPVVQLPGREAREGRLVWFDPVDDLAVIAVDGLDAAPLEVAPTLAEGAAAAVQGYPHGGPFVSVPAHVLSVGIVPVPDIYDGGTALREIYALETDVQPGNSGGPLLSADGRVAGVVFARGEDGDARGYAMTPTELAPALAAASASGPTVSSGACLR
ncbi:MarP family serine protease [Microbacterium sp.]|uniref:MarP family serine protease n=1 Tax=Microbacterium sp. TaxID=51671 RepID=UPI003221599A